MGRESYLAFESRIRAVGLYDEMREICASRAVTLSQVHGNRKLATVVMARRDIWMMLRDKYCKSYGEIAELFCRDHNTVMIGIRRGKKLSSLKLARRARKP